MDSFKGRNRTTLKEMRKMANEKLTVTKALTITILTTLTVLAYLGVMFWGLLATGSPALAWILGLVFAVAVILYCVVSMLLKTRKRGLQP